MYRRVLLSLLLTRASAQATLRLDSGAFDLGAAITANNEGALVFTTPTGATLTLTGPSTDVRCVGDEVEVRDGWCRAAKGGVTSDLGNLTADVNAIMAANTRGDIVGTMVASGVAWGYPGGGDVGLARNQVPGTFAREGNLATFQVAFDSDANPTGSLSSPVSVTLTGLPSARTGNYPCAKVDWPGAYSDSDTITASFTRNAAGRQFIWFMTHPGGSSWADLTAAWFNHGDHRLWLSCTYVVDPEYI